MKPTIRSTESSSCHRWPAITRYLYLRNNTKKVTDNAGLYHYAGNNPVRYIDPDGREVYWVKGEGVSDEDFKRVQQEADKLAASDTNAGRRYLYLTSETEFDVTIHVEKEGGSWAESLSDDGSNGIGSDSIVYIDLSQENKKADGVKMSLGEILAHEVSGHAYEINKGRFRLSSSKTSPFLKESYLRCLDEQIAVALQNEYRSYLGLKGQRKKYTGYENVWYMPIYDSKSKTWSLKNQFTKKMESWRLPR